MAISSMQRAGGREKGDSADFTDFEVGVSPLCFNSITIQSDDFFK